MKKQELASLAANSLQHRSLRSWLAILGIVIGVASIISLISISVGMEQSVKKNLGGLGANIITITSGGNQAQRTMGPPGGEGFVSTQRSNPLTFKEADALRKLPGVQALDARISGRATVSYRNKNSSISIVGSEPEAFPISTGLALISGATFKSGDLNSAVLGYSVENQTFGESMLNRQIKINDKPFRVIGILNQSGASFGGSDNTIFITQKAAKNLFLQNSNASSIVVIAANTTTVEALSGNLTSELLKLHKATSANQDFRVLSSATMTSTITSISEFLGYFLGGIALISLIVGGIGVANAMFTSVLEQTKYIGILKSLGTTDGDVMWLFFFESSLVGFVGGILGVALSFIGSAALQYFTPLPSAITPELIFLGMGFSILMGAIAGAIPALNASKVEPVEALRYE